MAFLTWEEKYKIGVPEMDAQHEKWLEIINRFYDKINSDEVTGKLSSMLDAALDYANYHFKSEEEFMAKIGYPKLNDQQEKHTAMTERLKFFRKQLEEGKLVLSVTVTSEMKKWFVNHILMDDKEYAVFYSKLSKS